MSRRARDVLRDIFPYATLPFAFPRHLLRPCLRVLMYHRVVRLAHYDQLTVTPERFEQQMSLLASRWRVVSLGQAVSELEAGGPSEPTVAVTFDDGYLDNLIYALPILRRHAIPATIFVTARFCDQSQRHPRYASEPGRLHLNWSDAAELAKEPGISIGSHTLSHPFLTRLGKDEAEREIRDSRDEISARIGSEVEYFCYPSGDLGARELELVASAGYRAAVSVHPGGNRGIRYRFALRRTEVTDRDGPKELAMKLIGSFDPVHQLLHWRRSWEFGRARAAGLDSPRARTT